MTHDQFEIGKEFTTASGRLRWRCTDIGKRTIVAIQLNRHDKSWYNGPPYAIPEIVLDENDLPGCGLPVAADPKGVK